jgi:SAM-dependent methyltransferase
MNPQTKKFLRSSARSVGKIFNGLGGKRQCYVCQRRFHFFTSFAGGSRRIPEFNRRLAIIGSDVDNFGCMYCDSHDRERHLFMFFDKLGIWDLVKGGSVLHFAPERNLAKRLTQGEPALYVRADLFPSAEGIMKIDATQIPFADQAFDLVIANHILEHIPDYARALREFHRVLKPGGVGILQTPYSTLLKENFEDEHIDSDELRWYFHGQRDHVRTFGEHRFMSGLEEAGFQLQIARHDEFFDAQTTYRYGVNAKEDLIRVVKPAPAAARAEAA